jgi:hypothetical protein
MLGVARPRCWPISCTAPTRASISSGRPAWQSCSMLVLKLPSLRVTAWRSSGSWAMGGRNRADGLRLAHHGADEAAHQRVVQDAVAGGAGERADRVHGHVAPELEPHVALDALGHRDVKAGLAAAARQRLQACVLPPAGRPMISPLPLTCRTARRAPARCCWRAPRSPPPAPPGSTRAPCRPGPRCAGSGLRRARLRPSKNHHGTPFIATAPGCAGRTALHGGRHGRQCRPLHGQDHQVLHAQHRRIVTGVQRHRRHTAAPCAAPAPPWRTAASVAPRASASGSARPPEAAGPASRQTSRQWPPGRRCRLSLDVNLEAAAAGPRV